MTPTEAVFSFLERTLSGTAIRSDARARPIAFEMLDDEAELWVFDPKREGPLFARVPEAEPALTISCTPELLDRLFRQGITDVPEDEPLILEGDASALDCLIEGISPR